MPGGGHGNPLQYSCLQNPMDRGAWWSTVHGVAKSWIQLKWLSIRIYTHHGLWGEGVLNNSLPFLLPVGSKTEMTAGTQAAILYYEVILEVEDVNGTAKGQKEPESLSMWKNRSLHGLCVSQFLFRERITLILFKSSFFWIFQFLPVKPNIQWSRFSLVWPWKLLQLGKSLVSYYSNALDIIMRTCSWCMFIEITFNLLLSPSSSAPDCSVFPHPWLILSPLSAIFPLRGRYLNIFVEYGEEIDIGKEIKNPEGNQGCLAEQCSREGAGKE